MHSLVKFQTIKSWGKKSSQLAATRAIQALKGKLVSQNVFSTLWFIFISFYIIHVHLVHPRPDLVYLVNHCGQAHFWQSVNKWHPNPNFWNSSSKSNLFQQILCFPCSQKGPMDISINPTGKSDLRKKSKNNNQRVAKKDPKKKTSEYGLHQGIFLSKEINHRITWQRLAWLPTWMVVK